MDDINKLKRKRYKRYVIRCCECSWTTAPIRVKSFGLAIATHLKGTKNYYNNKSQHRKYEVCDESNYRLR